jgi:alkanesulfonate monooxygenase SsuD/methylene tetrahydromethanopterin reductase-like flavin-dependent oxidoreductase (luciferase family)
MHHALFIPPFGELADPARLIELAVAAEAHGWDGLFLWDHVLRPPAEPQEIADVWIALAAVATATQVIRFGPMVTPIVRRRPHVLAKQALTLDHLSRGRLTLGLGLGVDTSGELSRFGEVVDPVERGAIVDEGAELLASYLAGQRVDHAGPHYRAGDVQLLPASHQQPRVPLWFAVRGRARRPVRRAARYEGLFAIEVDLETLAEISTLIVDERGSLDGFDLAVLAEPGLDLEACAALGATWAMWSFRPGATIDAVRSRIVAGPK